MIPGIGYRRHDLLEYFFTVMYLRNIYPVDVLLFPEPGELPLGIVA